MPRHARGRGAHRKPQVRRAPRRALLVAAGASITLVLFLALVAVLPHTDTTRFQHQYTIASSRTQPPRMAVNDPVQPAPIGIAATATPGSGHPVPGHTTSSNASGTASPSGPAAAGGQSDGQGSVPVAGPVALVNATAQYASDFAGDIVDTRSRLHGGAQALQPTLVADPCLLAWAKANIVRLSATGAYEVTTVCGKPTAVLMGPAGADAKVLVYGALQPGAPRGMRQTLLESTDTRMAFVAVRTADSRAQLLAATPLPAE